MLIGATLLLLYWGSKPVDPPLPVLRFLLWLCFEFFTAFPVVLIRDVLRESGLCHLVWMGLDISLSYKVWHQSHYSHNSRYFLVWGQTWLILLFIPTGLKLRSDTGTNVPALELQAPRDRVVSVQARANAPRKRRVKGECKECCKTPSRFAKGPKNEWVYKWEPQNLMAITRAVLWKRNVLNTRNVGKTSELGLPSLSTREFTLKRKPTHITNMINDIDVFGLGKVPLLA